MPIVGAALSPQSAAMPKRSGAWRPISLSHVFIAIIIDNFVQMNARVKPETSPQRRRQSAVGGNDRGQEVATRLCRSGKRFRRDDRKIIGRRMMMAVRAEDSRVEIGRASCRGRVCQ